MPLQLPPRAFLLRVRVSVSHKSVGMEFCSMVGTMFQPGIDICKGTATSQSVKGRKPPAAGVKGSCCEWISLGFTHRKLEV